jgi:hypothetical protein
LSENSKQFDCVEACLGWNSPGFQIFEKISEAAGFQIPGNSWNSILIEFHRNSKFLGILGILGNSWNSWNSWNSKFWNSWNSNIRIPNSWEFLEFQIPGNLANSKFLEILGIPNSWKSGNSKFLGILGIPNSWEFLEFVDRKVSAKLHPFHNSY